MTEESNIFEQANEATRRDTGIGMLIIFVFLLALAGINKILCWIFPALNN